MMPALKVGRLNEKMSDLLTVLPTLINIALTKLDRSSELVSKIKLIDTLIELYSDIDSDINTLLKSAFLESEFESADYRLVIFKSDLPQLHDTLEAKDAAGNLLLRNFYQSSQYIAIDRSWNAIYFLDKSKKIGGVWAADFSKIPMSSFITPLRTLLSWCVEEMGYELIHAAAVEIAGKGVALTGPSGSGKSTLAIYAATRDKIILGDDAVLISNNRMYAIYSNAKVDLNTSFFDLEKLGVNRLTDERSKKAILKLQSANVRFARDLPLSVIVLPEIAKKVSFFEIPKVAVLREFLPQTMKELLGGTTVNARNLFKIVSSLPFFKLQLGPDMNENLNALHEIVEMVDL